MPASKGESLGLLAASGERAPWWSLLSLRRRGASVHGQMQAQSSQLHNPLTAAIAPDHTWLLLAEPRNSAITPCGEDTPMEDTQAQMQDARARLAYETDRLRDLAAQSGDPRLSALLIAVTDERARELLLSRVDDGHQYGGALLSPRGRLMNVVFSFSRPEGMFGILPLSVLVSVDLDERRVVQVVDNYLPRPKDPLQSLRELRPDLNIRALAFEREDFDGEEEVAGEGDAEKKPKVAPPPKKSLWI
jgi:hypothetical protein